MNCDNNEQALSKLLLAHNGQQFILHVTLHYMPLGMESIHNVDEGDHCMMCISLKSAFNSHCAN